MTDEKIVQLYFERNETAIEETAKAYGSYFYHIAFGILQNEEDAKEAVNDTYLKAWNSIPPARPNPLKAFLGRITRQICLNIQEKKLAQKRGQGCKQAILDELLDCLSGEDGKNFDDTITLTDTLNRFLHTLPVNERRVFIKRYWYMQSISDIATDFSMSESKVKSLLLRQRKKLKQALKKEGYDI